MKDPIFILAAPRSGSSFLFETLARSPDLFTVGGESHQIFETIEALRPENNEWDSNRLTEHQTTPEIIREVRGRFLAKLRDRNGSPARPTARNIRMLEKTPKNALRIPFIRKVYPDALFIYLYREPRDNISSIIDAWRSGRFVMYPDLPGWQGLPWSLLLIPGWRDLPHEDLARIAAAQWESAHRIILDDLAQAPQDRICSVRYDELTGDPLAQVKRLCEFAQVKWDDELNEQLPLSRHTLTPPDPDKWKNNEADLERVLPQVSETAQRAEAFVSERKQPLLPRQPVVLPKGGQGQAQPAAEDLRSVHTKSMPAICNQLGVSLLVTTYQAGKLIIARADGQVLNTHFRLFQKPMGMAATPSHLAIGTQNEIQILRNMPDVACKLEPKNKHDACYLFRNVHITGDIDIHEMSWGEEGLWFINTRFSCLCTLDLEHSFVPRWRPPFISALSPEDRCHLNGLCLENGKPKYVTALGQSDKPQGWREHKKDGGILMEVTTNRLICSGLSMPHSPRLHQGKLWVLESGKGGLCTVDIHTGQVTTIATLPGFTRGLSFAGDLAFIGLSQVRETAVFSGIPITQQKDERNCGVWVVNIHNGQIVGFLKFEGSVQEIFAVELLPGIRFPEVLEPGNKLLATSYMLPDEALRDVPLNLRSGEQSPADAANPQPNAYA